MKIRNEGRLRMNDTFVKLQRTRWFYVVLAIILMLFLGLIYAWSVFRVPLEKEFGWDAAESSVTFSISMMTFCIGGLVSGIVTGKKGHRVTLTLCAVCLALGFGGASRIQTLMGIYITYGVLCGFGVGLGYNAIIGTVLRWFPDKQGLVSGMTLMGFGFGSMLLGTLGADLITRYGWRFTFQLFGIAFGILFLLGAVLLRQVPEAFLNEMAMDQQKVKATVEEVDYRDMLRRRNFWFFFFWAIAASSAGLAIMNVSGAYANFILGDNLTKAAAIAGIISITNGIGRVLIGQLFDWKGYRFTMALDMILYLVSAGILMLSLIIKSVPVLIVAYIFSGFAYGGISPNISAFVSYFFGRKHYAMNYSVAYLNLLVASLLGPIFGGGSYSAIFMWIVIFALIGFVLLFMIRNNRKKEV
ncbi:MFS transporter [Anaerotignum sp.]|uniref:MFS transporter n=1 Tax=Anaerotignum sp. TaxID=2039241 RepID=UPI00373504A2